MIYKIVRRYISAGSDMYPLYAFLLTFIIYGTVLSGCGMLGNGLLLLETGDWLTQHIPFIMQMGEVLKGDHSLWYSWNIGIGSGSIGSYAYYTFSPFNVLYWIMGEKGKHVASALVITLKAATAASAFQVFTKRFLRRTYFETILFSVLYALNGFAVCYFHSILSLDAVLIFPVIMTGLITMLREGKIRTLVLSYTYLFVTSLYMGYIVGISSFIIFVFYFLYKRDKINRTNGLSIVKRYCCSVLGALGLTAIIWIPCVYNMLELRNSDDLYEDIINCNPIMLLNNMFIGMYQSVDGFIPYYYCGLLSVMALPLFVLNNRMSKKKRFYQILCLFTFIFIILIPPFNYVMHGFDRPNGVGFRYSFILSFIFVAILTEQYPFMHGRKGLGIRYMIGCVGFLIIVFYGTKYYINAYIGKECDSNYVYILLVNILFIILLYVAIQICNKVQMDTVTKKTLFSLVIILEIISNIAITQKRIQPRHSVITDEQYDVAERNTIEKIRDNDSEDINIRTIYQNRHIIDIALENDLSSLAYFSSLTNQHLVDALVRLGYEYRPNSITGNGWTPVTLSLLGIDYIVDGASLLSDDPSVPVMIGADDHYYQNYYRNEKALPLAYAVDKKILDYDFGEEVFDNQNRLVKAMTGEEIVCFKPIEMVWTDTEDEQSYAISSDPSVKIINRNYPEDEMVLECSSLDPVDKDVFVNLYNDISVFKNSVYSQGPVVQADYDVNLYHTIDPRIYPNQIFKSGKNSEGYSSFNLRIPANIEYVTYKKGYFAEYDDDAYKRAFEKLNAQKLIILDFDDGYLAGDIICKEDCVLFSSIPYEEGWHAYVDGVETVMTPLLDDAFVGVELSKGCHNVKLEYIAPGMYAGRYITIGTLIIMMAYYLFGTLSFKTKFMKSLTNTF